MLKIRALEQIVRGFSNHKRIEILNLLDQNPELSTSEIASELKMTLKLSSAHTKRLIMAGLIMKRSQGKQIRHKLSERGRYILNLIKNLE
jgi:DNA-binding transcriptional ArsR family regulator